MGMDVEVTSAAPGTVVHVAGELDLASAPSLLETLTALEPAAGYVVVDLTDVSFLDSSGLSVLLQARQRLADGPADTDLRLVVTRPSIRRVLGVTGLTEVFAIFDSLDDATRGT